MPDEDLAQRVKEIEERLERQERDFTERFPRSARKSSTEGHFHKGDGHSITRLRDADGDTQVQVEESADEDKIRMDTAGTERAVVDSAGLSVDTITELTGNAGVTVENVLHEDGFIELSEISAPSSPAPGKARLYMQDSVANTIVFLMKTATGDTYLLQAGADAIPTAPRGLLLLGVKRT